MYYDSLNKIVFILLALTVPANYILFRIKPNLLHFKALENKRMTTLFKVIFYTTSFLLIIKLIPYIYLNLWDYFLLDIFKPYYYTTLVILLMWSICVLNIIKLRITLNVVFLISGILWLLGQQHHFYWYQIYTIISLNAAIIGLNMYPYKEHNTGMIKILDIILIWIAIIVFSFIYQQPMM
jgi:hypothetical protein